MMMRIFPAIVSLVAIPSASFAQQGDMASHMSCADYLKAEKASGWSNGITGSTKVDQLSEADARRTHDFCIAHPNENAGTAVDALRKDLPQDASEKMH